MTTRFLSIVFFILIQHQLLYVSMDDMHSKIQEDGIIFIGTGASSAIPRLNHIIPFSENINSNNITASFDRNKSTWSNNKASPPCLACQKAWLDRNDKNNRNNVSILLRWNGENILFDCGKTFRDAAMKWFPIHGIKKIDALILSHDHSDAMGGLDDLRDLQFFQRVDKLNWKNQPSSEISSNDNKVLGYLPADKILTFLTKDTYNSMQRKFKYIVDASESKDIIMDRKVACLSFVFINNYISNTNPSLTITKDGMVDDKRHTASTVESLSDSQLFSDIKIFLDSGSPNKEEDYFSITSFPVWHGKDYISLGFYFGKKNKVVYISDVSEIPKNVEKYLANMGTIQILIIDALFLEKKHFSHFNRDQAIELIKMLNPVHAYLVGMTCHFEHESDNEWLSKWLQNYRKEYYENHKSECPILSIQLAHDGLFVPVQFS